MGKFTLECPHCGSINTATTFFLSGKAYHVKCGNCNLTIDVKQSRLTSKACPKCGTNFVFDQAKAKKRVCPTCGESLTLEAMYASKHMTNVNCPQCACSIEVLDSLPQRQIPLQISLMCQNQTNALCNL